MIKLGVTAKADLGPQSFSRSLMSQRILHFRCYWGPRHNYPCNVPLGFNTVQDFV